MDIIFVMLNYNRHLKSYARTLRKNMTDAEKIIWSRLRFKQLDGKQFYRQKTIGNYIVDFYCPSTKLVVEVDGGGHYSGIGIAKDKIRDEYLCSQGLRVLRFTDREALNEIDGVMNEIYRNMQAY